MSLFELASSGIDHVTIIQTYQVLLFKRTGSENYIISCEFCRNITINVLEFAFIQRDIIVQSLVYSQLGRIHVYARSSRQVTTVTCVDHYSIQIFIFALTLLPSLFLSSLFSIRSVGSAESPPTQCLSFVMNVIFVIKKIYSISYDKFIRWTMRDL